jgi:hypothetical protein
MPVVDDAWFITHQDKIAWVKNHVPEWATRPTPLSVRELEAISKDHPDSKLGNSGTRRQVCACLKVDRIRERQKNRGNGEVVR